MARHFGFVVALAVGMAFGYAVKPDAQGVQMPALKSYLFKITPVSEDRVRLEMPAANGQQQVVENAQFRVFLNKDMLLFQPIGETGTADPIVPRNERGPSLPTFAFRVPPE